MHRITGVFLPARIIHSLSRLMNKKINHHISSAAGITTVTLMAVLILFSSCAIHKALKAHFEIPVTASLETGKVAVANGAACQAVFDVHQTTHQTKKPTALDVFIIPFQDLLQTKAGITNNNISHAPPRPPSENIPIYILYRKIKVLG